MSENGTGGTAVANREQAATRRRRGGAPKGNDNASGERTDETKRKIGTAAKASWIRRNAEIESLRELRESLVALVEESRPSALRKEIETRLSRYDKAISKAEREAERMAGRAAA